VKESRQGVPGDGPAAGGSAAGGSAARRAAQRRRAADASTDKRSLAAGASGDKRPRRADGPPGLPGLPDGVPVDDLHEVANVLHSAALRLLRAVRAADDEALDLDGPRASLLSVLVFAGPKPVTRLAELERVSPPAVTKTVAALEAAGLARRTRSERDRRVVLVSATPAGRRLLERGRAARVRAIAQLFADATASDLHTLREAAALIASRLHPNREAPHPPTPQPR
jgi:DNA-binding MarR family transcriptional regulator